MPLPAYYAEVVHEGLVARGVLVAMYGGGFLSCSLYLSLNVLVYSLMYSPYMGQSSSQDPRTPNQVPVRISNELTSAQNITSTT